MTRILDPDHIFKYLKKSKFLYDCNLIDIIKRTLLANPYKSSEDNFEYDKSEMWKEQAIINFPILYLASIYLYFYAKERGCKHFLFVTRDCCHWHKIFHILFPDCDVHYFDCSRNMLNKAMSKKHHPYDDYVKSIIKGDPSKAIYIDINGKCERTYKYFEQKFNKGIYALLLSSRFKNYSKFPKIVKKYKNKDKFTILAFKGKGSYIESLNLDLIGTLQDYTDYGPIRDKLEYNEKFIKPYHKCINYMLNIIGPVKIKTKKKKTYKLMEKLQININNIFQFVANRKPLILKYEKFITRHPTKNKIKNKIKDKIKYEENNYLNFKKLEFHKLLSNDTIHCLMWQGSYYDKTCAIKVVMLKNGLYYDQKNDVYIDGHNNHEINRSAAIRYFVNEEIPFLHNQYIERKGTKIESFNNEIKQLLYLNKYNLSPELYGYCIIKKGPFYYGFIVMDKVDCSLKQIILRRSLTNNEENIVKNLIYNLNSRLITHGDLKPSNIGVYLNKYSYIKRCVFLDLSSVKQYNKKNKSFKKRVKHDLKNYVEHIQKNINERLD